MSDEKLYHIGGLKVHIHGISTVNSNIPISILFLLHGRMGSQDHFLPFIYALNIPALNARPHRKRQLLVCTFDQRNHGHRLVDEKANLSYNEKNPMHAEDMYSILSGTAEDVSMLIDYLPSYLFPQDEVDIEWGVAGVSLGGHSTWLCLAHDERIKWGCSIIGSPSYIELMEHRLQNSDPTVAPSKLSKSFVQVLDRDDPGSMFRATGEIPAVLTRKPILVLSGKDDILVPWSASDSFINALQKVSTDITVTVYDGVGHAFTTQMMHDFKNWLMQFI